MQALEDNGLGIMVERVKRAERASAPAADASSAPRRRRGQLILFPGAKKPRGRPRKGQATPSSKLPDDVATAIAAISADKALWAAAKQRARQTLTLDRNRVPGIARAVGIHLLDNISRETGFDTRSLDTIAKELGVNRKAATRAYKQLTSAGHVLRMVVVEAGRGRYSKTTLPVLLAAATEVARERTEVGSEKAHDVGSNNSTTWGQNNPSVGSKKYLRWGRKNTRRGVKNDPPSPPHTPPLPGNPFYNPSARAREGAPANDEISNTTLEEGRPGYRPDFEALKALLAPKAPRFDRSRPLRERITTWPFGEPADPADAKCRRLMRELAKGWDLEVLKDQFCTWADRPGFVAPIDAQEAFAGWLSRTSSRRKAPRAAPAGQERDLGSDPGQPRLKAMWAAEDRQDAPLRVPFDRIIKPGRRSIGSLTSDLMGGLARFKR